MYAQTPLLDAVNAVTSDVIKSSIENYLRDIVIL